MLKINGLSHEFVIGKRGHKQHVPVLKDINFTVNKGEIISIVGRSGSGKSTLLNLISGYIKPTAGSIMIKDIDVTSFNEGKWADFRLENLGFIFQSFQLIPSMTAYENIELPLVMKGIDEKDRKRKTNEMITKVGLEQFAHHYPSELSGGQQQRVSIARALVLNPPIILADEPTGSLDNETEEELLQFINKLNKDLGITFVMITHDEKVAATADRVIKIENGELKEGKKVS
ncbi:acetoin utilization transport system ATP-binding protein [Bacillus pakistanensis]|uniref:Acetoin utilization transport system ATP-binding protein n=1 Tax=Rossellomorea pakistanensis TaxID=992288 RepID=A0ABS2N7Q7_9BACI|nr:ABC transporter ATP-binding protein [Bacillus pakistanensis]MBM7583859.1 acetoin utilization transport system ATP-binding protein [Bacillus pakistanensis]